MTNPGAPAPPKGSQDGASRPAEARVAPVSFGSRLEFLAYRAAAGLIRSLPLEIASRWSGRGWRLFAPWSKRHRRALEHIGFAFPDMPMPEREKLAREMWENLGRVFAESFHIDEIAATGRIVYAPGSEPDVALPKDMRFIACSAHIGNWEIGAAALTAAGGRPAGIYQRIKNPLVDADVRATRAPHYPGGLFPKQQDAALRTLRHLRSGGALVTMADLRDHREPPVPFFGRPARSTRFPALAARTLGLPLYACLMARTPRDGQDVAFTITIRRIEIAQTADREADASAATAALQLAFEDFIRQYPGQWMWAHRRWG